MMPYLSIRRKKGRFHIGTQVAIRKLDSSDICRIGLNGAPVVFAGVRLTWIKSNLHDGGNNGQKRINDKSGLTALGHTDVC